MAQYDAHLMSSHSRSGIRLLRGGIVEATHRMAWVCHAIHTPVATCMNPNPLMVFARSSLKPVQMAVLMRELARKSPEHYASIPAQAWAIGMASHSGDASHQRWVNWWLNAAGIPMDALVCGQHPPISSGVQPPSQLAHNCSGKHAAIRTVSQWLGWPENAYTAQQHPYFVALQNYLAEYQDSTSQLPEPIVWASDGCTLPTPALPLHQWHTVLGRFATTPEGQQCLSIMRSYPELISGLNASGQPRFDMALMQGVPDLASKVGAMGFVVIWHVSKQQVLVLKAETGSTEYRDAYAWWLLTRLGWVDEAVARPHIPTSTTSVYATVQNTLQYV